MRELEKESGPISGGRETPKVTLGSGQRPGPAWWLGGALVAGCVLSLFVMQLCLMQRIQVLQDDLDRLQMRQVEVERVVGTQPRHKTFLYHTATVSESDEGKKRSEISQILRGQGHHKPANTRVKRNVPFRENFSVRFGADLRSRDEEINLHGFNKGDKGERFNDYSFNKGYKGDKGERFNDYSFNKGLKGYEGDRFNDYIDHGNSLRNVGEGSVYTRWGRRTCRGSARVVYSGFIAGPSLSGGLSGVMCLPSYPTHGFTEEFHHRVGRNDSTWVMPARFHDSALTTSRLQGAISCALCSSTKPNPIVVPGWNKCPAGWTMEYTGKLMAAAMGEDNSANHVCIDEQPESDGGSTHLESMSLSYVSFKSCPDNSLTCSKYTPNSELPCSVCTQG